MDKKLKLEQKKESCLLAYEAPFILQITPGVKGGANTAFFECAPGIFSCSTGRPAS